MHCSLKRLALCSPMMLADTYIYPWAFPPPSFELLSLWRQNQRSPLPRQAQPPQMIRQGRERKSCVFAHSQGVLLFPFFCFHGSFKVLAPPPHPTPLPPTRVFKYNTAYLTLCLRRNYRKWSWMNPNWKGEIRQSVQVYSNILQA